MAELTEREVAQLETSITEFWQRNRKIATPRQLSAMLGHPNDGAFALRCQSKLLEEPFRCKIVRKGIPLSREVMLKEIQLAVIALLANHTDRRSLTSKLASLGVGLSEYRNWQKESKFRSLYNSVVKDMLEESYHEVQAGLINQAAKGDVNAVKFYYEITKKWDPNAKETLDVKVVLAAVIEIITTHITDPAQLAAIANDIQNIKAVKTIMGGDLAAPALTSTRAESWGPPVAGVVLGDVLDNKVGEFKL